MRQEVAGLRDALERERVQGQRMLTDASSAQIGHLVRKRANMLRLGHYTPQDPLIRQLDELINQLLVHEAFDAGGPQSATAGASHVAVATS